MPVPGAPQSVSATAGVGAGNINQRSAKPQGAIKGVVVITWSPPSEGEVVDYLVTASPGGATQVTTGFPWRAVFSGLDIATTTYTFDVVARNTSGSGDPTTSNPVRPQYGPGWLSQVFYSFVAQYAADGQNVNVAFGGEFKPENDTPPKVVWQPKSGIFTQTDFKVTGQIRTRSLLVPILCWAAAPKSDPPDTTHDDIVNYDAAESLMNTVAASLNTTAFGGDVFRGEDWLTQNSGLTTYGAGVILTVELKFPVVDYPQSTVDLTDISQTSSVHRPS